MVFLRSGFNDFADDLVAAIVQNFPQCAQRTTALRQQKIEWPRGRAGGDQYRLLSLYRSDLPELEGATHAVDVSRRTGVAPRMRLPSGNNVTKVA